MVKLNAFRTKWRKNMRLRRIGRKESGRWRHLCTVWYGQRQANLVLCEQRRFRRACSVSLIQAMSQEEPSDKKPDPWSLWMAGYAQLKFSWQNARRHKFAWHGPYACASVNKFNNVLSEDLKMNESLFYGENVYFCCCLYKHDKWCW